MEGKVKEKVKEVLRGTGGELEDDRIVRFSSAIPIEDIINVAERIRRIGVGIGKTEMGKDESTIPLEIVKEFN